MTDFTEIVRYDVPRYKTLRDGFIANAEISEDGKTLTVGGQTARKAGFLTWMFATRVGVKKPAWKYVPSSEKVPADFEGRSLLSDVFSLTQGEMIDLMASTEAAATLTKDEKDIALLKELRKRVAHLEAGDYGP